MELNILDWFQTLHTPILDKIMTSITKLGDAGIFWIILTLLFLIIPKMRKTGIIMAAALAGTVSYLCYYRTIHQLGASTAMALNITYAAWALLFEMLILECFQAGLSWEQMQVIEL